MAGRVVRKVLAIALIGAVAAKTVQILRGSPTPDFSNHPTVTGGPEPVVTAMPVAEAGDSWRTPEDGSCPEGFPVKAKIKSGIFHLPEMLNYDRTTPDRCYPSAEAAEADGLRVAKR